LIEERDLLLRGAWITLKEAVGGFVLGSGTAIIAALVLARWRPFGNALMPYMIAAKRHPIIAFAPITNAWFGLLSPWSKVTIAAVLCFFPVLVNTLRGLTSVDPESIELMRSYAAPERESSAGSAFQARSVCLFRLEGGERPCDDRRRGRRLLRRVSSRPWVSSC
jgi:NitT/TauT family transport system permease protein